MVATWASGRVGLLDRRALLAALRPALNAIIIFAIHGRSIRPSLLRHVLARATVMQVVVVEQDEHLEQGRCHVG
jgi:hypothetical protein